MLLKFILLFFSGNTCVSVLFMGQTSFSARCPTRYLNCIQFSDADSRIPRNCKI